MNYQYSYPSFGSGNYQLGNNFSLGGGFGADSGIGNSMGVASGLGGGASQNQGFFGGMSGLDLTRMGIGGLQTGFNIFSGLQANKLAKDQFRYTKEVTDTNLNNSIKSYNTTLEDRARARASVEGTSAEDTQAYIDRNRLSRG